ncbi:RNase H domain-containing protein [Trichonephila clavipes]|nr:RNase H domain-containing protein [Trichonephila clavipes]
MGASSGPHAQIYTDGSRRDGGISGSGVHVLTPTGVMDIKIKNLNFCSVFKPELIAIRKGLHWTSIGDKTSLEILNILDRISFNHCGHFQWLSSHVRIDGNEKADFLARTAAEEEVSAPGYLTFSELSSLKKIELHHLE